MQMPHHRFEHWVVVQAAADLDSDDSDRQYSCGYQPVRPNAFNEIVRQLGIEYQHFTFVDFGSGLGRAVLLASEFPFKKVIGVELSPQLTRIAFANVKSCPYGCSAPADYILYEEGCDDRPVEYLSCRSIPKLLCHKKSLLGSRWRRDERQPTAMNVGPSEMIATLCVAILVFEKCSC